MKHALIKSIGILIVELPEGATNVKLRFNRFLTYRDKHSSVIHLFDYKIKDLGKYSEMTEDSFKKILPNEFDYIEGYGYIMYNDILHEKPYYYNTAKESFLSALHAENWYLENPLSNEISAPDIEDWHEAQARTLNPDLIHLFKIEE